MLYELWVEITLPDRVEKGIKFPRSIVAHNFLNMYKVLLLFAPFERGNPGLSSGAKVVEIRSILRKLRAAIDKVILMPFSPSHPIG